MTGDLKGCISLCNVTSMLERIKIDPIMGPLARAAVRLPIEGEKRRKTLVLIAAYRDAGRKNPLLSELSERLGFSQKKTQAVIGALEREGWLRRNAKKKRYVLAFGPDGKPYDYRDGAPPKIAA